MFAPEVWNPGTVTEVDLHNDSTFAIVTVAAVVRSEMEEVHKILKNTAKVK